MKPALLFLAHQLDRVPGWVFRLALVAFWICLAVHFWHDSKFGLFGFVMFCLGEAWARLLSEHRITRLEKQRDAWEKTARMAAECAANQHAVFIEMGPHLEVVRDFVDRRVAAPKRKEEVN